MKVLILAGGYGTRLSEETDKNPKPMVEIGGMPILWHIMKIYAHYGFNEFLILLGYKGKFIKEYFANYYLYQSDVTFDLTDNSMKIHKNTSEPWKVTLIDTGLNTMTGGRMKRVQKYIKNETFMLTYGDGVCNLDVKKAYEFHKKHGKLLTLTAVQPEGRFGTIEINKSSHIESFFEKPKGNGSWINGGFFICEPGVLNYIDDDNTVWEKGPLENLASDGQIVAYRHNDFWDCMDTVRDRKKLNKLWEQGNAPWKIWD